MGFEGTAVSFAFCGTLYQSVLKVANKTLVLVLSSSCHGGQKAPPHSHPPPITCTEASRIRVLAVVPPSSYSYLKLRLEVVPEPARSRVCLRLGFLLLQPLVETPRLDFSNHQPGRLARQNDLVHRCKKSGILFNEDDIGVLRDERKERKAVSSILLSTTAYCLHSYAYT